ncbi:hypothetical protein [Bacillus cereus]|uniref:AbrB family transcriptional regulator n=1 Tax=Bacillus cereus TIAC219 TaxID=718222 RepID=A0ABC9SQK2_BACCE|nr:hypothetical protein [Bacillus cereus]EJP81069.1 hypothetical protein IC1_06650 [Bacillus cereus VD022]EOQ57900.1 hypothetical protein IAY_06186 [Bacillus cereus TIAC219]
MKADTSNGRPFLGRLIEINEEGSMIIPKDLLEYAGITEGSQVEVIGTSESLVFKTTTKRCDMCSRNSNTKQMGMFKLCERCYMSLTGKTWDGEDVTADKPTPQPEEKPVEQPKEASKSESTTIVEVKRNV